MSDLTPKTWREVFLNGLSDSEQTLPEPVTREQMFLKKAIEAGGGGSSLPEVTTEDEGKALVVNSEGVWDKGEIKGAPLTVDLDYNSVTKQATIRTEGVSNSDLYNKLFNGENIYLRLWTGTTTWKSSVGYSDLNINGSEIYAYFINTSSLSPSNLLLQIAKITSNDIKCSGILKMAITQ